MDISEDKVFICPFCNNVFTVPKNELESTVTCPKCKKITDVKHVPLVDSSENIKNENPEPPKESHNEGFPWIWLFIAGAVLKFNHSFGGISVVAGIILVYISRRNMHSGDRESLKLWIMFFLGLVMVIGGICLMLYGK